MKKVFLTAIAVSVLLFSLMVTICSYPVKADSTDSIHFIDSAVTIFSPVNMTYNYRDLTLDLTVPVWSIMGMPNNVSMNYTVDGIYNGPVPLRNITPPDAPPIATKVGMGTGIVDLPELPDGSHYLTIYLYGLNMQNYNPQFKSYAYTVYFSIDDPNSIFNPTPSPTQTPTPTPIPSTAVSFSPLDSFAIPALNSNLNFAYVGSYDIATLENNFWSFGGLNLSSLGSSLGESHSFDVSAQNCNVTITHIDTLSFLNHDQVGWLTYTVKGIGNQTFYMHWRAKGFVIGFKVYVDGIAKEAGDEWTTMWAGKNPVTDNMLTVTGAKHNVSIGYAINPEIIGSEPNFAPIPSPSPSPSPSFSPSPNLTPSSSPTQQPTSSPSTDPTSTPESNQNQPLPQEVIYVAVFAVAVLATIVVVLGLRKRHQLKLP